MLKNMPIESAENAPRVFRVTEQQLVVLPYDFETILGVEWNATPYVIRAYKPQDQYPIEDIPRAHGIFRHEYPLAGSDDHPVGERVALALELMYKPKGEITTGASAVDMDREGDMFLRWSRQALMRSDYSAAADHAGRLMRAPSQRWARTGEQAFEEVLEAARGDERYEVRPVHFEQHMLLYPQGKRGPLALVEMDRRWLDLKEAPYQRHPHPRPGESNHS